MMHQQIALSDKDARNRVLNRLTNDFNFVFNSFERAHSLGEGSGFPMWPLCRSLFPILEAVSFLKYGSGATSNRLSKFIRDDLASVNPCYAPVASIICQIWRHGLIHGDEPPILFCAVHESEGSSKEVLSVFWSLQVGNPSGTHLSLTQPRSRMDGNVIVWNISLSICINQMVADLMNVLVDDDLWVSVESGVVMDRYNSWCSKELFTTRGTSEERKAAQEVSDLFLNRELIER